MHAKKRHARCSTSKYAPSERQNSTTSLRNSKRLVMVCVRQETSNTMFTILSLCLMSVNVLTALLMSRTWVIHVKFSSQCHDLIRLSYAFKMRQDYLSTSYWDQKYLPSERSETREIWIDPSNVCWDNPVSFWMHMMIFFSHLSLFNRWNILKIWEKMSKWNLDGGPSHLRASYVLTT